MSLIKGTFTISGLSIIMVREALLSKIRNPGVDSGRIDFMLQGVINTEADKELIELCYDYMREISVKRRNSSNGRWSWKSPEFSYSYVSEDLKAICEICGCWLGDSYFYTNQNHLVWMK